MNKVKVYSKHPWLVHVIADCTDCEWECTDRQTALKEARNHARKTGHEVTIETGYVQIYNVKNKRGVKL